MTLGLFYGCRKDNSVNDYSEALFTTPEEYKSLIEEAKIYYENRLEILKKKKEVNQNKLKLRDSQSPDATFDGLDVTPQWDRAKVTLHSGSSFVELPFVFEDNQYFGATTSKNARIAPDEKSASRLVVSKNRRGRQSASFMTVMADDSYLNGNNVSLKNFTYQSVPNHFNGKEMYFNIDGSYSNGWHFTDGKRDGYIKKNEISNNNSLSTRGSCFTQNYCIEIERFSVRVGNYQVTYIQQDCSYAYYIGICGGWNDYEYDYSPTTNNWGNYDNNPWGPNGDENTMRQAFDDQIKDELQHGCLSDVLNDVKALPLCHTLAAFNDGKIPNINLTFKEGNLSGNVHGKTSGAGNNQTITLGYNNLTNSTDLFIATTILHESVHAWLIMYLTQVHPEWYLNTVNNNGNVPIEAAEYKILLESFHKGKSQNDGSHLQMKESFVDYIANNLRDYASWKEYDISNIQIFKDLAWAGLDYSDKSFADRERIKNRIIAERDNITSGIQAPKGKATCK